MPRPRTSSITSFPDSGPAASSNHTPRPGISSIRLAEWASAAAGLAAETVGCTRFASGRAARLGAGALAPALGALEELAEPEPPSERPSALPDSTAFHDQDASDDNEPLLSLRAAARGRNAPNPTRSADPVPRSSSGVLVRGTAADTRASRLPPSSAAG